jgi:hypothetical protein
MSNPILDLLRTSYGWDVEPSAIPHAATVERAIADGQSAHAICTALSAQAARKAGPPRGHRAYGDPTAEWAYKLRWTFGSSSKFGALETSQALGYQPQDAPFPGKAGARTAEDLLVLAGVGWHWNGKAQFLDLSQDAGKAEYERRVAFARAECPRPWDRVDRDLYDYLILVDRLPSTIPPFGVRVSELFDQVYGLTLQQWLDNQWRTAEMLAPRWLPDGSENK